MYKPLHVLHADDDTEDRWFFREGILEVDAAILLTQFEDGTDLLHYLQGATPATPEVHLIVCDMQMNQMGGIGLLEAIKKMDAWKHIPVVIFSTSSFERDIHHCLSKGAAAFFSKPGTYAENLLVIRQMLRQYSLQPATSLT